MSTKPQWLAQRVARDIEERYLRSARPGGRLMPVRQLAEELGVCVRTTLAAQKLLAKRGVLEIRHGSGVYMADRGATRRVALVSELDLLHPRSSSFFAATVRELRRFFSAQGIETEFFMGTTEPGKVNSKPSCGRFIDEANARRLDGAVLVSAPETAFWQEFIHECPMPLVGAGTPCYAGVDTRELLLRGMRSLAEQGGKRIAVLGWGEGRAEDAFVVETAIRFGMETRPGWIRHDLHPQLHGAGWEEFREVWSAGSVKPDSLLITDDVLLPEALIAIAELRIRVPDQLRIATHSNAGAESKAPFPVTLLRVDPVWCADRLGEMLLARMNGETVEPGMRAVPIEAVPTASVRAAGLRSRVEVAEVAAVGNG